MEKTVSAQHIPAKEKWMYGFAGLGQNILYVIVNSFLMFYLTDVYGISPIATGTMMMIARVWDAINDPIMGLIAESTRTKWGKLRPYILFSLLPIGLFTVLNFIAPSFGSPTLKLVWCYIVYIGWGMSYTMCDIPYWGLSAAMTDDSKERTNLLTMTRILTMVGMAIGIVGIPILIGVLGGATTPQAAMHITRAQNRMAYTTMAIICSIVGCSLLSLAFFGTHERFDYGNKKASAKENLKTIFKNTPLMLVLLASILGFGRQMTGVSGMYVAMWTFGSTNYYALLGGVIMIGTILAILVTPLFLKKISKKQLFIYSSIFGVAANIIMYVLGRIISHGTMKMSNINDIYVCIALLFFTSLAGGFFTILQTTMIGDSVDYLQWKTGVRAEGLCFSGQTFVTKLSSALCTFALGIMLNTTGYITVNAASQPQSALMAIFQSVTLWPAVGCALSIIPILWYTIDDKKQKQYIDEIKARKLEQTTM
jgi:sugar (glycoside-pentoside-hexuronide) transporter